MMYTTSKCDSFFGLHVLFRMSSFRMSSFGMSCFFPLVILLFSLSMSKMKLSPHDYIFSTDFGMEHSEYFEKAFRLWFA